MKKFLIPAIILALSLPSLNLHSQETILSKERIVRIAMDAFQKAGGNLKERIVIYDVGNGRWEKTFGILDQELISRFEVLLAGDYQAVCFALKPKPNLKGKNVWVFVDTATKEVLALYVED